MTSFSLASNVYCFWVTGADLQQTVVQAFWPLYRVDLEGYGRSMRLSGGPYTGCTECNWKPQLSFSCFHFSVENYLLLECVYTEETNFLTVSQWVCAGKILQSPFSRGKRCHLSLIQWLAGSEVVEGGRKIIRGKGTGFTFLMLKRDFKEIVISFRRNWVMIEACSSHILRWTFTSFLNKSFLSIVVQLDGNSAHRKQICRAASPLSFQLYIQWRCICCKVS